MLISFVCARLRPGCPATFTTACEDELFEHVAVHLCSAHAPDLVSPQTLLAAQAGVRRA